jgi:hypothetical protein
MVEADSFSTEVTLEENYVLHHFEVFLFLSLNDRKCCTGISDSSEERVASVDPSMSSQRQIVNLETHYT